MAKQRKGQSSFHQLMAPLLFLTPNILIFSVFIIIPTISGLRMSLFQWSILGSKTHIGLDNFFNLFSDADFWHSMSNTLHYVLLTVPALTASAFAVALLVSASRRGEGIYRGLYYLPTMLSFIITGIIWRWILGDEIGIFNYILRRLGHGGFGWLTTPIMAKTSLIFITLWSQTGFYMVMFVGGLQAIPDTYFEAAKVDGANKWNILKNITLPMIRPTMLVVIVLATINSFKAFELIFVLTRGGPGITTKFLVQSIYQVAFEEDRMGYASAMAIVLMLVISILTLIQFRFSREYHSE